MSNRLSIKFDAPGAPPGKIPLADLTKIADAIQTAVQRLVAFDSGLPEGSGVSAEVREASTLLLTKILEGSTILECEPKFAEPVVGETAAIEASRHLVSGISEYTRSGRWPRYLPRSVRQHLGAKLAPVIKKDDVAALTVSGMVGEPITATINYGTRVELQKADELPTQHSVTAVGEMYEANKASHSFKIKTDPGTVIVEFDPSLWERVDELRWKRIKVVGLPLDPRARRIGRLQSLDEATAADPVGVHLPEELHAAAESDAYVAVLAQIERLSALKQDWDSYGAKPPSEKRLSYSRDFFYSACKVLLRYDIAPPPPFVTATHSGNPQFEWSVEGRELELEVSSEREFEFLIVAGEREFEGTCQQRDAIRYIRWVATGE
jgi:hypothetical protein